MEIFVTVLLAMASVIMLIVIGVCIGVSLPMAKYFEKTTKTVEMNEAWPEFMENYRKVNKEWR